MAQTAPETSSGSSQSTLARGKACLRCRKRKMRCDGQKPACGQCVKAHKVDTCQFDDGKGKTRTQALREKIARLEEEIAHLRDPENPVAPAIVLHDPHASGPSTLPSSRLPGIGRGSGHTRHSSGASTSSSSPPLGSPSASSVGLSTAGSPYGSLDAFGSPSPGFAPTRTVSPALLHAQEDVPPEILQGLLEIVLMRRNQCGLALHVERLRSSVFSDPLGFNHAAGLLSGNQAQRSSHPVLSNAIYLWASFISRPGPLSLSEQMFLAQTQSALVDALNISQHQPQSSPRILQQDISRAATLSPPIFAHTMQTSTAASAPVVIDTIQASVLLSRYFFAIGRLHEASYYSNAAASLAIQSGLHQINSTLAIAISQQRQVPAFAGLSAVYSSALRLPPPQDSIELGERINLFWQVFILDRLLSVALRRPPTIVDDDSVETRIDTPWPENVEEYEHMPADSVSGDRTLQTFFLQQGQASGSPGGFSALALRAKASALYGAATHVSTNLGMRRSDVLQGGSSSGSGNPAQDFHSLEQTIVRFMSTLLPAHQLGAGLPDDDRRSHIVIHTLAHAAYVQLNLRFAREGDMQATEKCLRSARSAVQLVRHLVDSDYDYLDPTFGACWCGIASVFGLDKVRAWQSQQPGKPQQELEMIVFAMTRLSARFPIMEALVARVFENSTLS